MFRQRYAVGLALASVLFLLSSATAQAQTATPTATPTATATASPLPAKVYQESHKERESSTVADPKTAAPRIITMIASDTAVNARVVTMKAANSFRIRGLMLSADAVGSVTDVTLKVNGVTIAVRSLVGYADTPVYVPTNNVEVKADQTVSVTLAITGNTYGLLVQLDTIP